MNYHLSDSVFYTEKEAMDALTDFVDCNKYVFRHAYDDAPAPGAGELGWHYHNCYELLYFLRGDADYQIQHNHYTLRPRRLAAPWAASTPSPAPACLRKSYK